MQLRLIPVVVATFLSGCCWPGRRGDASLTTCLPLIGRRGDRSYHVGFHRISLTSPSVRVFHVRALPPAPYHYDLVIPLPLFAPEEKTRTGYYPPPWADATVSIAFLNPDGSLISQQTYQLGKTIEGFAWPEDHKWRLSLDQLHGIDRATDYDVRIAIVTPAKHGTAHLEAYGTGNVCGNP